MSNTRRPIFLLAGAFLAAAVAHSASAAGARFDEVVRIGTRPGDGPVRRIGGVEAPGGAIVRYVKRFTLTAKGRRTLAPLERKFAAYENALWLETRKVQPSPTRIDRTIGKLDRLDGAYVAAAERLVSDGQLRELEKVIRAAHPPVARPFDEALDELAMPDALWTKINARRKVAHEELARAGAGRRAPGDAAVSIRGRYVKDALEMLPPAQRTAAEARAYDVFIARAARLSVPRCLQKSDHMLGKILMLEPARLKRFHQVIADYAKGPLHESPVMRRLYEHWRGQGFVVTHDRLGIGGLDKALAADVERQVEATRKVVLTVVTAAEIERLEKFDAELKAWHERRTGTFAAKVREPVPAVEPERNVAVPADIVEKLGLSAAQKARAMELEAELDARVAEAVESKDPKALKAAYRWFRQSLYRILTEDQRVRWAAAAAAEKAEHGAH